MIWHRALQAVVGAAAPQEPMVQALSCGTRILPSVMLLPFTAAVPGLTLYCRLGGACA